MPSSAMSRSFQRSWESFSRRSCEHLPSAWNPVTDRPAPLFETPSSQILANREDGVLGFPRFPLNASISLRGRYRPFLLLVSSESSKRATPSFLPPMSVERRELLLEGRYRRLLVLLFASRGMKVGREGRYSLLGLFLEETNVIRGGRYNVLPHVLSHRILLTRYINGSVINPTSNPNQLVKLSASGHHEPRI
jgi:hypothetical protein